MSTMRRLRLALLVLGIAAIAQSALLAHLYSGPSNIYGAMKNSLSELPMVMTVPGPQGPQQADVSWQFLTLPDEKIERDKLPYVAVDLLYRRVRSPLFNIDANLFVIQTDNGEDRKHHPEICWRDVARIPEDVSARAILKLKNDDSRPVQRYSFVSGPGRVMTVYYWHYTFLPDLQQGQSKLQAMYQAVGRAPPSVTVQLTTSAPRERWPLVEDLLVEPLERTLRNEYLPASVKMQCDRLPIGLIEK